MGRPHLFTMSGGQALAPPPAGWFTVHYGVTIDGRLAELCADQDVRAAWATREAIRPGGEAWLRSHAEEGVQDGPRFPLKLSSSAFDRMPDGSWAVAETRCSPGELNARILRSDGSLAAQFCAGDGIQHLQCDAGIWIGYFDEGVFGNFGWGRPGRPPPIGAAGLNRFDARGDLVWSYRPPPDDPGIADCYALNVTGDAVWSCYYTDFPVLRIMADASCRVWRNRVKGATALAVTSEHGMLVGGYGEDASRAALVRLGDRPDAVVERTFRIETEPGRALGSRDFLAGRGACIHVVSDGVWRQASVADFAGS